MAKISKAAIEAREEDVASSTPPWEDETSKEEMTTLYFEWAECRVDPGPYKPLSPLLIPSNLRVAVEVPTKYVTHSDEERSKMILTLEGWAFAQFKIRSIMEKFYVK